MIRCFREKKNSRGFGKTHLNASVTVSAALSIPIFLFAILSLVFLLEISAISLSLHGAMVGAAKNAAVDVYKYPIFNTWTLKRDVTDFINKDRLDRSIIVGGTGGLNFWQSSYSKTTEEIEVVANYKVRIPFPGFDKITIRQQESLKVKAWTGYVHPHDQDEEHRLVYVTETGSVYHTDYGCTHLQLSISFVSANELSDLRNEGGGKYHPCEKCSIGESMAGVFITNHGNKYHHAVSCSGLKRTIRTIPIHEVKGRGPCSRCSK